MTATFTAATWNTAGGTPAPPDAAAVAPVLDQLDHHEVSVLLLQELSQADVVAAMRRRGWLVHRVRPQYGIAWRPDAWTAVRDPDGVRLADTPFHRHGGPGVYVEAARAVLCDRLGRSLTGLSYHTPSHVQVADAPAARVQALRESMATLRTLATAAQSRACLFGGDDNVDERLAHGPWRFMLQRATGLQLVQAPEATHAGGRRLDDFRVRGLEPLHGLTLDGAGDHRVHVRVFRWL